MCDPTARFRPCTNGLRGPDRHRHTAPRRARARRRQRRVRGGGIRPRAVDRARIDERAGQGQRVRGGAALAVSPPLVPLVGAQLGITITSLLLGVLAEPAVARALEPGIEAAFGEVPTRVSVAIALAVATVVQMIFGELIPKAIATTRPLETLAGHGSAHPALRRGRPTLVALLDGMASRLTRRAGVEPTEELEVVPDRGELEHLIRSSGEEGTLDEGEVELLTRSIRLADKSADDAMVPRPCESKRSSRPTPSKPVALASRTGHSRFPVAGEDLDDVLGVVHVKSVHGVPVEDRATTLVTELMTPCRPSPSRVDLDELLVDLRQGGNQLAVVIDEHGGCAGIITLEDILEEIVGEIDDEYDDAPTLLTRAEAKGSTVVPASLHPDEVEAATGFEMPEGEFETLAGLVLDRPATSRTGEMVELEGWRLEVVAMDRLRIAHRSHRGAR